MTGFILFFFCLFNFSDLSSTVLRPIIFKGNDHYFFNNDDKKIEICVSVFMYKHENFVLEDVQTRACPSVLFILLEFTSRYVGKKFISISDSVDGVIERSIMEIIGGALSQIFNNIKEGLGFRSAVFHKNDFVEIFAKDAVTGDILSVIKIPLNMDINEGNLLIDYDKDPWLSFSDEEKEVLLAQMVDYLFLVSEKEKYFDILNLGERLV